MNSNDNDKQLNKATESVILTFTDTESVDRESVNFDKIPTDDANSSTSSDEQMDHNEEQENDNPDKLNHPPNSSKKSKRKVLQNSRYT